MPGSTSAITSSATISSVASEQNEKSNIRALTNAIYSVQPGPVKSDICDSMKLMGGATSEGMLAGRAVGYASAQGINVSGWKRFLDIQKDFSDVCENILTRAGRNAEQIKSFQENLASISEQPRSANSKIDIDEFKNFILRLDRSDLKDVIKPEQVAMILEEVVASSPDMRELIFTPISSRELESEELALLLQNEVLYLAQASRLLRDAPEGVQDKILDLSLAIFRVDLLSDAKYELLEQKRQEKELHTKFQSAPDSDGYSKLELGLLAGLRERLSLPFEVDKKYITRAQLNSNDLDLAAEFVKQKINDVEKTAEGLVCQKLWRNYLNSSYLEDVKALKNTFANEFDGLDNRFGGKAPGMGQCSEDDLGQAEKIFCYKEKTREILKQRQQNKKELLPSSQNSQTELDGGVKRSFDEIS